MLVQGVNLVKRFQRHLLFKNLNFQIDTGDILGISGRNGTGKSTLLKIIGGYLEPSEGEVKLNETHFAQQTPNIGFSSPYLELPEELSLHKLLHFHSQFKMPKLSFNEMAERTLLPLSKPIADFSTGMKHRVQLLLCFYFQNDLILFDEPTSNLDEQGFLWWSNELLNINSVATVIASNQPKELNFSNRKLDLNQFT